MSLAALQALAAVLGGTNSLHTNSLDEALALPTREAATIALRTQQVIAHESGVTHTVDPLGGSYFVERLTREAGPERRIDELIMKAGTDGLTDDEKQELRELQARPRSVGPGSR